MKRGAVAKAKSPLFVSAVLQTIWDVYEGIMVKKDNVQAQKDKMAKICATLKIKVSARDSQHPDPKVYLRSVFGLWLPLAQALLGMICKAVSAFVVFFSARTRAPIPPAESAHLPFCTAFRCDGAGEGVCA